MVSIAVIGVIGIVGYTKGLDMLQKLEKVALGVTLLIICALMAGFAFYDFHVIKGAGIQLPKSLVALNVSKKLVQRLWIALVALALGFVTRFAVPAG